MLFVAKRINESVVLSVDVFIVTVEPFTVKFPVIVTSPPIAPPDFA